MNMFMFTLYRSIHGAVGTLHTCLLLRNFQQIHVHVHMYICVHVQYMYSTCVYVGTCNDHVHSVLQITERKRT